MKPDATVPGKSRCSQGSREHITTPANACAMRHSPQSKASTDCQGHADPSLAAAFREGLLCLWFNSSVHFSLSCEARHSATDAFSAAAARCLEKSFTGRIAACWLQQLFKEPGGDNCYPQLTSFERWENECFPHYLGQCTAGIHGS